MKNEQKQIRTTFRKLKKCSLHFDMATCRLNCPLRPKPLETLQPDFYLVFFIVFFFIIFRKAPEKASFFGIVESHDWLKRNETIFFRSVDVSVDEISNEKGINIYIYKELAPGFLFHLCCCCCCCCFLVSFRANIVHWDTLFVSVEKQFPVCRLIVPR